MRIDDGEPFAVQSCEVRRDVDHSTLTAVVREGETVHFAEGSRVTLLAGDSVLFVGRAVGDDRVLDLMSAETDGELPAGETI